MLFTNAFTTVLSRGGRRLPSSSSLSGGILPKVLEELRRPQTSPAPLPSNRLGNSLLHATARATSSITNSTHTPELPPPTKMRKTQLRNDLKQYRRQQADPLKKPPYTVFTNAVLEEIYSRLPTTHDELLQCKGIGPKKLEMFGDDILSIVAPYTNAYGGIRTTPSLLQSNNSNGGGSSYRKPMIDAKSLTKEQKRACDLFLQKQRTTTTTRNGFITGSAGTGKSFVLKYLVQELQKKTTKSGGNLKVGVCAPTGVAAIHVGGSTLHSWFGIGLGNGSLSSLVKKVLNNPEALKRIDETDVLIIDECSMLSSDLLETLDALVRQIRRDGTFSHLPFGGMQVICFGDFFQLPPIVPGVYDDNKPFCFESPVWHELGLSQNMIELQEVQRQKQTNNADNNDDRDGFVSLLNKIRIGTVDQDDIQQLNERCVVGPNHPFPDDGIVPTRLYSLNKDVDGENESRLAELDGEEIICRATNTWKEPMPAGTLASIKKAMIESLRKELPDEIRLKIGAQVMLTRNKDLTRNLVNGSRGIIVRFDRVPNDDDAGEDTVIPIVRFDNGMITSIPPVESVRQNPEGNNNQPGCLSRKQVPLKLAWALTVHKSQGTTLTRAILDISSAFEYGQCYVALSRVRSLQGLWLVKPARLHNIKVSPQVLDFYYHNNHNNNNMDGDLRP